MTSKLMDTEPGGEQTQYEGIDTFTKPHATSEGQLGNIEKTSDEATAQQKTAKQEKGEQTAEKIRYGEAISEHGFGGETTGHGGEAQQNDYGAQGTPDDAELTQTRREQRYGPGNNVGA